MARGEQDRRRAPPKNTPGPPRPVQVSKLLSRLLRHDAVKENIPLSPEGYVDVSDLLAWRRAKSMKVTLEEIIAAVKNSDKQRFGLKYIGNEMDTKKAVIEMGTEKATLSGTALEEKKVDAVATFRDPESAFEQSSITAQALQAFNDRNDNNASHYLIRATQGHSIKDIASEAYLTPVLLEDSATIPQTVVHGTFHAAWPHIVGSGGLRPMTRTHIHFATGPTLEEVRQGTEVGQEGGRKAIQSAGLGGTVISGMRSDAQVLIYIDIQKALRDGVLFWRSENGVILSEGVPFKPENQEKKGIGSEYFTNVVEIREGVGTLWEDGKELNRLPQKLVKKGMPRGKGDKFEIVMRDSPDTNNNATVSDIAPPKAKGRGKANERPKLKLGKPGDEYDD